ncbi:MAG TPA: aminotransferase class III-fold pyridoxal phosphate-dependent enzyme, partial [Acidimicrobiia bacterium]|nr:aminotransferase class III-fold pyridoxal phosphate-dependent enzyme [Acidimicrobiia bacterium]
NRFLDFNAGIAVTATGHCHPHVVEAIDHQARSLIHYCSSDWFVPAYTELCERLAASAPMHAPARVFLGNSGTEAVEAAIKLTRHATGRPNVIAFHGAFHGRSLGSLSLTASKSHYRGGFGALMPGVFHAPYGEFGYIERVVFRHLARPQDVAAIFVEPIQGEGGYVVPPAGWIAELRALCDEHGIALVVDEVQSGVGRTGRMWAIEHEDVQPDVLLAGKGLASGLPLSAVIARDDLMQWEPGMHGSTFGGNPVACAAALATLDLMHDGLIEGAAAAGAYLRTRLDDLAARHAAIREVRGRGLMIGVELADHDAAEHVEQETFRRGLIVLTAGASTIRLSPALVVTNDQIDTAVRILDGVLAELPAA